MTPEEKADYEGKLARVIGEVIHSVEYFHEVDVDKVDVVCVGGVPKRFEVEIITGEDYD